MTVMVVSFAICFDNYFGHGRLIDCFGFSSPGSVVVSIFSYVVDRRVILGLIKKWVNIPFT
jgi:hypothetical protein